MKTICLTIVWLAFFAGLLIAIIKVPNMQGGIAVVAVLGLIALSVVSIESGAYSN